jgi:hypothetical protein
MRFSALRFSALYKLLPTDESITTWFPTVRKQTVRLRGEARHGSVPRNLIQIDAGREARPACTGIRGFDHEGQLSADTEYRGSH